MKQHLVLWLAVVFSLIVGNCRAADDIVYADFEGTTYGQWKTEGTAFGSGPAQGTLPGQMDVQGFQGKRLASSFHGGDDALGRLTSPDFVIDRKFITFLIGGGGFAGKTCLNLVMDGSVVRTATGQNTRPGGSERLALDGWDVDNLKGKTAHLEIVDDATGGWGHISVDQILFTDRQPVLAPKLRDDVSRDLTVTHHWLSFPISNGAEMRTVTVHAGGQTVYRFQAQLADGDPQWWSSLDVSPWRGKTITVTVDRLLENSHALTQLTQSDKRLNDKDLYHEALRPQIHFSAQRGWLNDPNGLIYSGGEYHLFFQHSPFSWNGSLKWWGHAVSKDLVHWEEIDEALWPDDLGDMYSGSAVLDRANTSGLGKDGKGPLVLIYTAAGNPFTQCIAASTDGHAFTKYPGNPVLKNIGPENRDPRVFWYEPTKRWVMALWVGQDGHNTIHFSTSPNLRDWTPASNAIGGKDGDNFLFECPDIFPLALDGDPAHEKWILTAANGEYAIGTFDGRTFTAEVTHLPGPYGSGVYAAQTFNDEPHGRRIQIGWARTDTPGMPFNQSMNLPMELRLVTTPDGPRMTWTPVKELESLRSKLHSFGPLSLAEGAVNPFAATQGELLEVHADFEPGDAQEVAFQVRGVPVVYDASKQEIVVNGLHAPAPLHDGHQRLTIFTDRTGLEVFAGDGRTYVPMPINLDPKDRSLAVSVKGGTAQFTHLDVYELNSIWKK
jgi:fructan beta-fructosidase